MTQAPIAAIATARGEGAVGIIRLSGAGSLEILKKIFVSHTGKDIALHPRELLYGHLFEGSETVDEVLCVYMPAPYTFTREEVAEIHCHGGQMGQERVLSLVLSQGARLAQPGEFTKRAFLNGRIDLTQAQAVIDLVRATSEQSRRLALSQLQGGLAKRLWPLREGLTQALAAITVSLDFPEEDIEELSRKQVAEHIQELLQSLYDLAASYEQGRQLREGLRTAIIGRPNVGKSSLLNALLGEERAIVTDIAGTTRDVVEETVQLGSLRLLLADTAGIRQSADPIEQIGIERSKSAFASAELVLLVLDRSCPLEEQDKALLAQADPAVTVIVLNKTDLPAAYQAYDLQNYGPDFTIVQVSALSCEPLRALEQCLIEKIQKNTGYTGQNNFVAHLRQKQSLLEAIRALEEAKRAIESGLTLDLIETDLREAWQALGQVSGETASEDLLDVIFRDFCIGK